MDDKAKEAIILEALSTAEGTKKLVHAMVEPLRCPGLEYSNEKYDKLYLSDKEKVFCLSNKKMDEKLNTLNLLTKKEKVDLLDYFNDLKIRIKNLSFQDYRRL